MTMAMGTGPSDAAMQAYTERVKPTIEVDEPRFEGDTGWTITTPVPVSNIVLKRFFRRGVCVTYNESLARQFVNDHGYTCTPELAPLVTPKAKALKGKTALDMPNRPDLGVPDRNLQPVKAKRTSR